MTKYDAYNLINLDDFNATGLVSRKLTVLLGSIGLKDILITKGNRISILYDDVFLSLNMNGKNPFEFGDRAIFVDPNNDLWLGIKSVDQS